MKINKWLAFASSAALLCSCADDFDTNDFTVQRPGDVAQYDYLKEYGTLKEYADDLRKTYPNMKLGVTVDPEALNAKTGLYALVTQNFDEVSASGMQQSDFVGSDGAMDFSKVATLSSAVKADGISAFGASLLNNGAQQTAWFQSLVDQKTTKNIVEVKSEGIAGWDVWGTIETKLIAREPGAADVVDNYVDVDGKKAIKIVSNDSPATDWDTQFFIQTPGKAWQGGEKYHISFWYKASAEADCATQCHKVNAGDYIHWACLPQNPHFTTEWQKYDMDGVVPAEGNDMQNIAFNLSVTKSSVTYYFADVVWEGNEFKTEREIDLANPTFDPDKSMEEFVVREYGAGGDVPGTPIIGAGPDGRNAIKVSAKDMAEQEWDTQFFIFTPETQWAAGTEVTVSMWIKADRNSDADTQTQCHGTPGGYKHWACLPEFPRFTTEWTFYEKTFEIPAEADGMQSIAFNLNADHAANNYYFSEIHWKSIEKASAGSTYFYVQSLTNDNDMSEANASKNFAISGGKEDENKFPLIGGGPDGANCVRVTSNVGSDPWSTQFFITSPTEWSDDATFDLEMDVRASEAATSNGTQAQVGIGEYIHWTMLPSDINFTTEWSHVKFEGFAVPGDAKNKGCRTIAINLDGKYDHPISYEFANVKWTMTSKLADDCKGQRELTMEEKCEAITNAYTNYVTTAARSISAEMNEIILLDKPITNNVAGFDYAPYLATDYIKTAHDLTRAAYIEADSTNKAEDLKLYVNEVLDATTLETLKEKLAAWTEAGIQIDGISVEYTANAGATTADEVNSLFKSLNSLGLPTRVSSLKMEGASDTFEALKKMEDTYKIVIASYVANIAPENQRGIILNNVSGTVWLVENKNEADHFTMRLPGYAGIAQGLGATK